MSSIYVPLELSEKILEDLSTDIPSLKACATVCSSWLPKTRRLLFHSRTLHYATNYEGLFAFLRASPHIVRCIKHLDIRGHVGPCLWMTADMAQVCSVLNEVESLLLSTIVFEILDVRVVAYLKDALIHFLNSVKHLSITHVMFDDRIQMQDFICAFPNVSRVSLRGSGYMTVQPSYPPSRLLPVGMTACPRITSLQLDDCYSEVFSFLARGTTLDLRHWMIHTSVARDASSALTVDPEAVQTVESLHLWLEPTSAILCNLPSKLPALSHFIVEINVQAKPQYKIEWLQQMLANLSQTVIEIKIRMKGRVSDFTDWGLIDDAIESGRFKVLKRVTLEFQVNKMGAGHDEESLMKKLEELKLFKRKLLYILFSVIHRPY